MESHPGEQVSIIDEVRARIDIVELIGKRVALQKAGKNYRGLCPFHSEKTPSFFVYPEDWSFHCFGCNAHGNGFDFVMRTEGLDFAGALRHLAAMVGLELPSRRRAATEDETRERLHRVLEAAAQYYHHLLLGSPVAQAARDYLDSRGLRRETMESFQLGYSPDRWDALTNYLAERGFPMAELAAAGLLVQREDGRAYDRFRGRLMFPIHDPQGRIIAFGARALDDSQPKYINSPQTPLFDKGSCLYALHRARDAIREQGCAIIVEGYMDALMAHQHGQRNVVATMGAALSREHLSALKRLTRNIVLALDPDAAGDEATQRGLAAAEEVFERRPVPVPTWRGWVTYKYTLDANLRVMSLPPGKDPDEVIREDPAGWQRLVKEARPVVDFLFATFTSRLDPTNPEDRERARDRLLPVVREISDPAEQAHYLQRLALFLGVREEVLRAEMARRPKSVTAKTASRDREVSKGGELSSPQPSSLSRRTSHRGAYIFTDLLEDYCLALLLRCPQLRSRMGELSAHDVKGAHRLLILKELQKGLSVEELGEQLEPELREYVDELLAMRMPNLDRGKAEQAWTDCLRRLRQRNLRLAVAARGLAVDARKPGWEEAIAPAVEEAGQLKELDRSLVIERRKE